jgi:hypothetical protein
MATNTGTAVAVRDGKEPPKDAPAEKLLQPETIAIPAALILAAEAVSGTDDERPWLEGVFIHSKDGQGRVAGTDGARMFLGAFPLPPEPPSWLAEGVIVSSDSLRPRVTMIAKGANGEGPVVKIAFAKGQPKAVMTDVSGDMQFVTPLCTGTFPDYDRVINMHSFTPSAARGDWEPVGLNSQYLKHIGDIAKTLESGLPKQLRSKEGMVIRAYTGDATQPIVFDFPTWPGALLVVMPSKLASITISPETTLLLTPALRGTIGALRGQVTRQLMRAQEATSDAEREEAETQAKEFQDRVEAMLKRLPASAVAQLEAPEPDLEKVAARRVKRVAKRRARARGEA